MAKSTERTRWVSYLRVSTVEQTEKELSLTAKRHSEACPGFRVRVEDLDDAVLAAIADAVCMSERAGRLARRHQWPPIAEVVSASRNFIAIA